MADVEISDHQLWNEFKSGNKEAYKKIYNNYLDTLYDYGRKIVDDDNLVQDCIHDLFVDLWKNRTKLEVDRSIKNYLLSSIRRKVLRKAQRERKHKLIPNFSFFEDHIFEDPSTINPVKSNRQKKLKPALDQLTKRQKEVIYLKFYNNLDYEEVAGVMDISLEAVYNHTSKALSQLRVFLKQSALPVLLSLFSGF